MQAARPQRASRDTGHPGPAYGKADPEAMKAAALQRTLPGNWSPARASTAATAPSEVRTNLSQLGTHRVIRGAGGIGWRLRPRWSRCGGCRGTHVLLPVNWLEEAYGHPHPYTDALHYYSPCRSDPPRWRRNSSPTCWRPPAAGGHRLRQ